MSKIPIFCTNRHLRALLDWTHGQSSGFSMVELIAAIGILSLSISLALSSYSEISDSYKQSIAVQQVISDLRRAKAETVSAGGKGIFALNVGNNSYSFGIDYSPYNSPSAADSIIYQSTLPSSVTLQTNIPITFDSRGFLVDANGDYTNATLSLSLRSDAFKQLTLYPSGVVE